MKIFAHRGMSGCTDIGHEHLIREDVKGQNLKNLAPENSEASVEAALQNDFGVEIDVVMTIDRELIITHTNKLSLHSWEAAENDYVSEKKLDEILKIKTGKGGQTATFLTYKRLLELLKQYQNLSINVEIKGNIDPEGSFAELTNPTIVEKIIEQTPEELFKRIVWSSFAISSLIEMKKFMPDANTAMLFCSDTSEELKIYSDKYDTYLKFNPANLQFVLSQIPNLNGAHPCIDSIDDAALNICNKNKLNIRTWALNEKNPLKDNDAKNKILNIIKIQENYTNSSYDIITDYPLEVKSLGVK